MIFKEREFMNYKPASRKSELVDQRAGNETLLYDLRINKAFCLNETSALVYQLSDGNRSVAEISDLMSTTLKDLVSEEMVCLALQELKKNNLLENADELTTNLAGITRREIIRKAGLVSMIALPIITGLVAPAAASAQSGCVPDGQLGSFTTIANIDVDTCFTGFPDPVCCSGTSVGQNYDFAAQTCFNIVCGTFIDE
jgi:hypothetical protein